jgi:hypothetical protein
MVGANRWWHSRILRFQDWGDGEAMSFFDDQEDDWFANDCKGAPSDYYAGELAPWLDDFTDTSAPIRQGQVLPRKRSRSQKRRGQRRRAEARKAQGEQR